MHLKNFSPSSIFDYEDKSKKYHTPFDTYKSHVMHSCYVPETGEFPDDEFNEDYNGIEY